MAYCAALLAGTLWAGPSPSARVTEVFDLSVPRSADRSASALHRPSTRRALALASLSILAATFAIAAPATKAAKPAATPAPAATTPATPSPAASAPSRAVKPTDEGQLDAIAAMVNDEPVLASDVDEQLYLFLQRSGARPDSSQFD